MLKQNYLINLITAIFLFLTISKAVAISNVQALDSTKNSSKNQKEDAKVNIPKPINDICKKSYSIENGAQLNRLSSECHTIVGSLTFDNYQDPIVDLGNIEVIDGNLVLENSANIVRIDCPKLNTIKGEFKIQVLTSLTSIHLKELHTVQKIYWRVVPILSTVEFVRGLSKIEEVTISDTSLVGFEGFSGGKVEQLKVFNINNNRFMETINCNIQSVSEQLSIQSNAKEIQVNMDKLVWANNMTVRDTSMVSSPNLQYVNNSLEFISNHFSEIDLPKLKAIGGTLRLDNNKVLSKIDMNNVSDVFGGVMITSNNNLEKITFLKSLQQIGGGIHFTGSMKDIELPKLRLVKGSVQINSTSDELDCSSWTSPPSGISIIRGGKIECSSSKKQTKISLNDKGEILDTATTDLDPTDSKSRVVNKNLGIQNYTSETLGYIVAITSIFLFFLISRN
ncbi:related to Sporulation-specific protein 22 [Hanseniaspora guilliermondii]|uniref:Related to Sporulation-specific protein 22 n=1 Tax=Hanseniaspora guilliermondii TaxID=56406 RepID=A0A1L0B1B8_9ASCO|nr:related to Sporulation-specific protein 22 [Hanseniaspora guilliermondii]